jgi:hypothetical protein
MNSRLLAIPAVMMAACLILSCVSGKKAYQHGDYYAAVLEAVEHLRHSPDNKSSKQVLTESYQPAVDLLNTDAQNQIASNANQKWKLVVQDYVKINNLYENIRTSPGALTVIPTPVNKYKELTLAKDSAANECYNAALQDMLKNTRQDAKTAFFLFTDANTFSPGFKECIEMIQQAKLNATLNVVVDGTGPNNYSWTFDQIIYGSTVNQFVKFYSPQQVQTQNIARIDQRLRISVGGYEETRPYINRTSQNYVDSVATGGDHVVKGVHYPNYQRVFGSMSIYEKQIVASGSLLLYIQDNTNQAQLANTNVTTQFTWRSQWANCSGDPRAFPRTMSGLCNQPENYPSGGQLIVQTKKDLDNKLVEAIGLFYRSY